MHTNQINKAVILANGAYPKSDIPLGILYNSQYVVCCDGAANRYIKEGHVPNVIVGDGDSLSDDNKLIYKDIISFDSDQETNDQTKAVKYLLAKGITDISIIGATGNREDHTLGNIALLIEYKRMGANIKSYTDYGVFIPCCDTNEFEATAGAQVSIFNINATNLKSEGLVYPIYDFNSLWQGTLNESITNKFKIEAKGEYIVYITYLKK